MKVWSYWDHGKPFGNIKKTKKNPYPFPPPQMPKRNPKVKKWAP